MTVIVEIAVQDAGGARAAVDAGADRLELCQALTFGGLTPSIGLIEAAAAAVGGERLNVLIRPRGGGFVYDAGEVALVAADIVAAVRAGAGGVVVGALNRDGLLDRDALRRWRDAAGPAEVVFHRAIDASAQPADVFDALCEEGVDRVLTSGGAPRSVAGVDRLAEFVRRGGDRIEVMAGGGVVPDDIPAIIGAGVAAVHLSARGRAGLDLAAGPGGGADGYDVTDPAVVAAAVAAARGAAATLKP
ncbi:copper homeostasis protein CutC [Microbacterium invictum]|uniref:PF03932 family protein CutC n=1 Tax=Microbacterium invictum TaxID=515415 RepID=A0AA40SME2_9MICO|nr:copper homeostasis protein CutC [Microbacterium invictum]MBB4138861.1 copper homeostasis protein [Microbacterium invictum]